MDFQGFEQGRKSAGRLQVLEIFDDKREGKKEREMSSGRVWVRSSGDGEREL
jgi:hypothetical protein